MFVDAQLTGHPRRRPIWLKDWQHCAFMSTPRAFANGGVVAAGGGGPGTRNQCLIMCGGYDEVLEYCLQLMMRCMTTHAKPPCSMRHTPLHVGSNSSFPHIPSEARSRVALVRWCIGPSRPYVRARWPNLLCSSKVTLTCKSRHGEVSVPRCLKSIQRAAAETLSDDLNCVPLVGHVQDGRYLTSAEVAQSPVADVFFPLEPLKHTRVLGTLAEATQWGKQKVLPLLTPSARCHARNCFCERLVILTSFMARLPRVVGSSDNP